MGWFRIFLLIATIIPQYWRIPASLSAESLRAKQSVLTKAIDFFGKAEGSELDIGQGDVAAMAMVFGPDQGSGAIRTTKKKKEKRGTD